MGNNAQWAAALAAGYLLGRSKKMKLAVTIASGIAFQQMKSNPNKTLGPIWKKLQESPEFKQAAEKVTSGLGDAAKGAALATAGKGVDAISRNLQERTAHLRDSTSTAEESDAGDSSEQTTEDSSENTSDSSAEVQNENTSEQSEESASDTTSANDTTSADDTTSEASASQDEGGSAEENQDGGR